MYAQCRTQFSVIRPHGTIGNLLSAFRTHAATQTDTEWVIGYCYDDTGMSDHRHLTRHDLDAVSQERPVFVSHITSHMGYANTLGLAKLGVTADFSVEGGMVVLGNDGMPEGLLKENAYFKVFQKIPACRPRRSLRKSNMRSPTITVRDSRCFRMEASASATALTAFSALQPAGPGKTHERPRLPAFHAQHHG